MPTLGQCGFFFNFSINSSNTSEGTKQAYDNIAQKHMREANPYLNEGPYSTSNSHNKNTCISDHKVAIAPTRLEEMTPALWDLSSKYSLQW